MNNQLNIRNDKYLVDMASAYVGRNALLRIIGRFDLAASPSLQLTRLHHNVLSVGDTVVINNSGTYVVTAISSDKIDICQIT